MPRFCAYGLSGPYHDDRSLVFPIPDGSLNLTLPKEIGPRSSPEQADFRNKDLSRRATNDVTRITDLRRVELVAARQTAVAAVDGRRSMNQPAGCERCRPALPERTGSGFSVSVFTSTNDTRGIALDALHRKFNSFLITINDHKNSSRNDRCNFRTAAIQQRSRRASRGARGHCASSGTATSTGME